MAVATIALTVPGELVYRDVAIRAVAAAARLVRSGDGTTDPSEVLNLRHEFDAEVVSAVSEIFNNIVIHGYGAAPGAPIEFEFRLAEDVIEILITDHGTAFDIESVPAPELEQLPEGGMGIHIARSCVDSLDYTPGPPNLWHLTKRTAAVARGQRRKSTQA